MLFEYELERLGVLFKNSRPYHPQTCGKVERFHQTLKRWLAKRSAVADVGELQRDLDRFRSYYNDERPHRALGRRTPADAFVARPRARPSGLELPEHTRIRRDRIDGSGAVTLRHDSRLHHIKIGRRFAGTRVVMLVAGLDVRIVSDDGELLRELVLDPTKSYQALGRS